MDRQRLSLLYDAWNEFNAKRYDRATKILDQRAALVRPVPLDWMLRAQIAEAQGGLTQALEDLRRIPDSDSIAVAGVAQGRPDRKGTPKCAERRSCF